jgi:pyruvate, orthophosphate dikinase
VAAEVFAEKGITVNYLVGTMIELPRAALTADEIATVAEFFSFGTNDLTQTTFGLSRDDAGKFLPYYVDSEILEKDPFQTIDFGGVGQLLKMGVEKGRSTRPNLKVGICGEHGGDPSSVEFCDSINLNYVSCSPFRVPIARIAAAKAAIAAMEAKKPIKKAPAKKAVVKKSVAKKVVAKKAIAKKAAVKKAVVKKASPKKATVKKAAVKKVVAKKPVAKKKR